MTDLIYELAAIHIKDGYAREFEERVVQASEIFLEDSACHSVELLRSIETPLQFRLRLGWESVEAHERFRLTDGFRRWRELVGPLFAAPPSMEHADRVFFRSKVGLHDEKHG